MKRRTAIRNVILVSAGAAFLHACQDKASVVLKHIPITGAEEDLLNELTESIIPKTDFIGAKDLKSADFVFMMADDCLSPEDQSKFSAGMKSFDEECKAKMGSRFVKLSQDKRNEFLTSLDAYKVPDGDAPGAETEFKEETKWFYNAVKRGTIQNFTSSERFLTEVRNYTSLIPAKFKPCVPVTNV